ncbi:hypothetical protein TKV_c09840 [Thermoanaerobacter kivui]|uniref:Uncharacterized protein n=1 Tax=Thermoanaerobacter kivui TaxID=2325 RepID=A0A097AQP7_THEKI|nr:hypothetical protein [Thermoanaerobacter kivui]AIS52161.1 hypothetical protein TKV_c09840 [Thermoanaerobacter kivui]
MKFLARLLGLFTVFFIVLSSVSYGQVNSMKDRKIVIFIIDRVNLKDYVSYDLPNIKYLMENGTYGIMTVNSDGGRTPENVYMTIGCGTRAVGSEAASANFNAYEIVNGEPASVIFERNSGIKPKEENIVNLDIAQIQRNNLTSNHIVVPGLLGKLLKENGRSVAVFGNEDTDKDQKRCAPLIAMDERGIIDFGDVSENILKKDLLSPFGIMTDYDVLYQKYMEMEKKPDLTIFQLGDTSRANDYQRYASDEVNRRNKKRALENADEFIGRVIREGNPGTLYIVLTPMPPSKDMSEKNYLTPIILFGPGFTSGYVTSETTKRDGIVTNIDVMPTILKYFNIPIPAYLTGHPLYNSGHKGDVNKLLEENYKLVYNYTYRPPFLKTYVALQIIILILSLITLIFLKKYSVYMKPLLFFVSSIPLTFLLLPLFNYTSISNSIVGVFFLTAVAIIAVYEVSPYSYYFYAIISLITTIVLLVDLATGQYLLKNSFLSYDAIGGARFYGIGNEYMGTLIGATLCFTTMAFEIFNNRKLLFVLTAIIYALVFYFIAAPSLGTNVGGGIAAFGGFAVAILLLSGKKINVKNLLYIGIGIILMLLGLFYLDSLRPVSQQTHIGQTFALVKSHGIKPLLQIFERKLLMNYKLIKYSIWSRVLLTLIIVLMGLFFKPVGVLSEIFKKHKYIQICFVSTIIGSIFALIFNDSGIVTAATMMVFMGPMLIHFVIDEVC